MEAVIKEITSSSPHAAWKKDKARRKLILGMYDTPYATQEDKTEAGYIILSFMASDDLRPYKLERFFRFYISRPEYCHVFPLAIKAGVFRVDKIFMVKNFASSLYCTILTQVAIYGYIDVAQKLLNLGADINGKPAESSPLEMAIRSNQRDMVDFLLQRGADPNYRSPMSWAICGTDPRLVHLLIFYGADAEIDINIVLRQITEIEPFIEFLDNTIYYAIHEPMEDLVNWIVRIWKILRKQIYVDMLRELIKRGVTFDVVSENNQAAFNFMVGLME